MWAVGGIAVLALVGGYFLLKNNTSNTPNQYSSEVAPSPRSVESSQVAAITPPSGFEDKISFASNGKSYTYGPIPGHWWQKTDDANILGVHYNGQKPFPWASDKSFDTRLYDIAGQAGTCKNGYVADKPQQDGFVHYHASNEDKNVGYWLKHTAVTAFTWAGPAGNPDVGRKVAVGLDTQFPNICEGGPA